MAAASQLESLNFSWGRSLKLTISGASHAPRLSFVLEGFPCDTVLKLQTLSDILARRKPGKSFTTSRSEDDYIYFDQGIYCDNGSLICRGTSIAAHFDNQNIRPQDYRDHELCRPGHADYTARARYGDAYNLTGGGPFSGRMTLALAAAGALCLEYLQIHGIYLYAYISQLGSQSYATVDTSTADSLQLQHLKHPHALPVYNQDEAPRLLEQIEELRHLHDSVGGEISCVITGLSAGLGGPLFEGLESQLASILFAIPSVKSLSFGDIDHMLSSYGSEFNDQALAYVQHPACNSLKAGQYMRCSNHAGGVEGGISNGMPLSFTLRCKPTPSILKEQSMLDAKTRTVVRHALAGRHDPSVLIRAVPVVEAASALALLDTILFQEFQLSKDIR